MSTTKRHEGDGQPPPEDLGRVTSGPLTEVRTVLSRARTAYMDLTMPFVWTDDGYAREPGEGPQWRVTGWSPEGRPTYAPHPQGEEMVEALRKVVELLEPWERTGR